MNHISRFFILLTMLLAITCQMQAQDDFDKIIEAEKWYSDYCKKAILEFERLCQNPQKHPQKFCVFPYEQTGSLGCALAIASMDESEVVLFTPDGDDIKAQPATKAILSKEAYWRYISDLGSHITQSKDITLRERPLPVRTPDKKANSFEVVVEDGEQIADILRYNQMMFKPHRNTVKLAGEHHTKKFDEQQGVVIKDQMEYVFKLTNPTVTAKMFRGYDDTEMCPWVVKSSFFDTHHLLQYNRWKEGEPIKKADSDALHIISDYYGGRAIKDSRWLATVETAERTFYAVEFEIEGTDALAAMVCIGEGEVASTWEFRAKIDPATYQEGESLWFVDDEGSFMDHAPEIHCITPTEEGLELYVRLFGGESVQYFILRETGSVWMEIQADYWVYVWD